jgi:protein SCO1/2
MRVAGAFAGFCASVCWFLIAATSAPALAAVDIINHQGTKISSRDLHFVDDAGKAVLLDSYFHAGKPVLMALAYYDCPGVCTIVLNGMVEGLKPLVIVPGRAFEVVVVSIDPTEGPKLALEKKQSYLKAYGRPETEGGWHFLTGKQEDIARLTEELGFRYERDPRTGVFIHGTALFVLTPEAVLSSTLTGVKFSKKLLRIALLDAAGGRMGTFLDRLSSACYSYLPHGGWLDRPSRWLVVFSGLLLGLLGLAGRLLLARRGARKRAN